MYGLDDSTVGCVVGIGKAHGIMIIISILLVRAEYYDDVKRILSWCLKIDFVLRQYGATVN